MDKKPVKKLPIWQQIILGVLIASVAIFIATGMSGNNKNDKSTHADYQQSGLNQLALESTRLRNWLTYKSAVNEIQASIVYKTANSETDAAVTKYGQEFTNWVGKISDISTTQGGTFASFLIKSDGGVEYRPLSPIQDNTPSYARIASMKNGQRVFFSGKLTGKSPNWERSITERGSLEDPEFRIEFSYIGIDPQ